MNIRIWFGLLAITAQSTYGMTLPSKAILALKIDFLVSESNKTKHRRPRHRLFYNQEIKDLITDKGASVDEIHLGSAIIAGNIELVKICIEKGKLPPEWNGPDNKNSTQVPSFPSTITLAAQYKENTAVTRYLLKRGASPNNPLISKSPRKLYHLWGPLHFAAENDDADMIQILLEHGADIYAQTRFGDTPYDIAIKHNKEEATTMIEAIIEEKIKHELEDQKEDAAKTVILQELRKIAPNTVRNAKPEMLLKTIEDILEFTQQKKRCAHE